MSFTLLGILNSQAAGGAAGAYDHLETVTLTGSASSISFTGLDAYSDYKHLQIRSTVQGANASNPGLQYMYVNNDTGDNYAGSYAGADGSSNRGLVYNSQPGLRFYYSRSGNGTGEYAPAVIDIFDFANTDKKLTVRYFTGYFDSTLKWVVVGGGMWNNQAVSTQLEFYPDSGNYGSGSSWSLYGTRG